MYREILKELGLFTLERMKGQVSSRGLTEKTETFPSATQQKNNRQQDPIAAGKNPSR